MRKNWQKTKKDRVTFDMSHKIAVIGMSMKYPNIENADGFARFLERGDSLPQGNSDDRGALLNIPDYSRLTGNVPFITGLEYFDNRFFGIVSKEAVEMQPEMKLSLMLAVSAVYDAGYSLADLRGSDCGMVIASSSCDYKRLIPPGSSSAYLDSRETMIGGKLSYYFDLTGPVYSVDSTCSSSLLSVVQAAQVLLSGQADMMLAGGTQLVMPLDEKRAHEVLLGAETAKLPYRPFDKDASGFVAGEGAGFVFLKRFEDAVKDNDRILGVISGSGISGSRADRVSLYAPDHLSQSRAIERAWAQAGVTADDITEIEAHGAATELGDANEVKGLGLNLSGRTVPEKVHLGSVKSNVGHTSQAAGISSLIKVLVEFRENVIYPIANFCEPKPDIDFSGAHLAPVDKLIRVDPEARRVVGIDSYGLNALNVHVVVENYNRSAQSPDKLSEKNNILKISGRTETAFAANAAAIREFIGNTQENINDVIYTLNSGRDDFRFRRAVTFSSTDELIEMLGNIVPIDMEKPADRHELGEHNGDPKKAAALYNSGSYIDFNGYYSGCGYNRVSAPTYCFDKVYNWVLEKKTPEAVEAAPADIKTGDDIAARLRSIWKDVLETEEDISDDESFFELGGNSMLGTLMIESVNEQFGTSVEIGDIYTYPTIAEMADHIAGLGGKNTEKQEDTAEETRSALRKIWKDVLETEEDISDDESFFELGGNSMLGTLMIESVNEQFGTSVEIGDIYTYPTIAEMADHISGSGSKDREKAAESSVHNTVLSGFCRVLEMDGGIGETDSFFDLGGNLLLADELCELLNEALGTDIDHNTIYEFSTVSELAKKLERK